MREAPRSRAPDRPRMMRVAAALVALAASLACDADDFARYDTLGESRGTSYSSRDEARDDAERAAEDEAMIHCAAMGVAGGYSELRVVRTRCRTRDADPPYVCDVSWRATC